MSLIRYKDIPSYFEPSASRLKYGKRILLPGEPDLLKARVEQLAELLKQPPTNWNDNNPCVQYNDEIIKVRESIITRLLNSGVVDLTDFNKPGDYAYDVNSQGFHWLWKPDREVFGRAWKEVRRCVRYGLSRSDIPNSVVPPNVQNQPETTLERLEHLLGKLDQTTLNTGSLTVFQTGHVSSLSLAKILNDQQHINLKDKEVAKGDAIWWSDNNGRVGYYKPNRSPNQPERGISDRLFGHKRYSSFGDGELQVETSQTVLNSKWAAILGSDFGSLHTASRIAMGCRVVYSIPEDGGAEYRTDPITKFGIIKAKARSGI